MKPGIQECGIFIDKRDAQAYRTVKIGHQTWFAENLRFQCPGSKAYKNYPANAAKYGLLYDWATAKACCPDGWHLPSQDEWNALTKSIGGEKIEGLVLKAISFGGCDAFGFSALPGGLGYSGGGFLNVGNYGYWWSSSESNSDLAYSRGMRYYYEYAGWDYDVKSFLFSVRCLQD